MARLAGWLVWMLLAIAPAWSMEYHGQVLSAGLPVMGATVMVSAGGRTPAAVTDRQGFYFFAEVPDGPATVTVEMTGFSPLRREVVISSGVGAAALELRMLSLDEIRAAVKPLPSAPVASVAAPSAPPAAKPAEAVVPHPSEEQTAQAADGLLINGSVNNAATSKYTLSQAFGNNRPGVKGLYTGGVGVILDNSALDARPFSLSGLVTPKPSYNRVMAILTVGGPIRIPRWRVHGPDFFVAYQFTRDRNDSIASALVPDLAERMGIVAGVPVPVAPQAQTLLQLYPLPNIAGDPRYNYQVPLLSGVHQDAAQTRLSQGIKVKDQLYGNLALQSLRASSPNLFGWVDRSDVLGIDSAMNWAHRFNRRLSLTVGYRFSRLSTRLTPFFDGRQDVSGAAGVAGNDRDPMYWGPPNLIFTGGIAPLTDGAASFNRNRTDGLSLAGQWLRAKHTVSVGGDLRRQQFNDLQQGNPRGTFTFTFTGAATGSDVRDFLQGVPDISALAFANADKYLRQTVYDVYATDDWRATPSFTLNAGVRWEYGAPISELKDRLVNLDVAAGFATVAPVLASDPRGPLTGEVYPRSLLRPDRADVEPRVGLSWKPFPASTVVVRAGYGVYADTSVYQATALQLAQQSPLSTSLSVQNSASCPLTLAGGFKTCGGTTAETFAADPNFRVGYAQNWQLSVQRDFPGSLQVTGTYLGIKGTRGNQEFLPNTKTIGAANPCPRCAVGFAYLTSNGNSTREAAQLQVRRRLHHGLTASLLYTYSKSIDDDAALGGQGPIATGLQAQSAGAGSLAIAQDWRDLRGERGLSTFDQRHLLNGQLQYTTGQGLGGGTLLGGWRGTLLKEWTAATQIVAGSGLPETPVYPLAVPGTGFSGGLRPNATGAPLFYRYHLNAAAFAAPPLGEWGSARRNSIAGPGQFTLNTSFARTFRLKKRYSLDLRVDSSNLLNHVTYTSWVTAIGNAQFGLPVWANPMRSLQTTLRLRF